MSQRRNKAQRIDLCARRCFLSDLCDGNRPGGGNGDRHVKPTAQAREGRRGDGGKQKGEGGSTDDNHGDIAASTKNAAQHQQDREDKRAAAAAKPAGRRLPMKIRVMGSLVAFKEVAGPDADSIATEPHGARASTVSATSLDHATGPSAEATAKANVEILLDDGTACMPIIVPKPMAIHVTDATIGMTLECVARRITVRSSGGLAIPSKQNEESQENPQQQHNETRGYDHYYWWAETLMQPSDPDTESLRWAEVAYRDHVQRENERDNGAGTSTGTGTGSASEGNKTEQPDITNEVSFDLGYPCQPITTNELLRLIQYQASSAHDPGVTVEDLSLALQCPLDIIKRMVQEMQMAGQIYQNSGSGYVPL